MRVIYQPETEEVGPLKLSPPEKNYWKHIHQGILNSLGSNVYKSFMGICKTVDDITLTPVVLNISYKEDYKMEIKMRYQDYVTTIMCDHIKLYDDNGYQCFPEKELNYRVEFDHPMKFLIEFLPL